MTNIQLTREIGKWGGRITAILIFLLWGAFFVEHMREWFLRSDGRYPPPHVWVAQLLHLLMLAGFAMMVKWDKAGAVVALVFSVAFFLQISRFHPPAFALINLVPMALFCLWWFIPDPARNSPSPGGV